MPRAGTTKTAAVAPPERSLRLTVDGVLHKQPVTSIAGMVANHHTDLQTLSPTRFKVHAPSLEVDGRVLMVYYIPRSLRGDPMPGSGMDPVTHCSVGLKERRGSMAYPFSYKQAEELIATGTCYLPRRTCYDIKQVDDFAFGSTIEMPVCVSITSVNLFSGDACAVSGFSTGREMWQFGRTGTRSMRDAIRSAFEAYAKKLKSDNTRPYTVTFPGDVELWRGPPNVGKFVFEYPGGRVDPYTLGEPVPEFVPGPNMAIALREGRRAIVRANNHDGYWRWFLCANGKATHRDAIQHLVGQEPGTTNRDSERAHKAATAAAKDTA